MRNKQLFVSIVGKNQEKYLEECIGHASKISQEILYVDLGSNDNSVNRAEDLGAKVIKENSSLEETARLVRESISSNWVVFLKPNESLKIRSGKNLDKLLKNKNIDAYVVTTENIVNYGLLEPFQLIKKLDQFKNVRNSVYVPELQIRLVRRKYTTGCLDLIINSNIEKLAKIRNKIIDDLVIESISVAKKDNLLPVEDHDLLCLKGKLSYDPTLEEGPVELSEKFTGFRVFHKGYFDSLIEGAQSGFGNFKMYVPMLQFLNEHGDFEKAREFYETWVQNRREYETYHTNSIGGFIYSNLLELDKAIECYEKIIGLKDNSSTFAKLGHLYLLKNDNQKAIEYLEKVDDVVGDVYLKRLILSIINRPEWKPAKLGLCMIARDEEGSITKAIQSVEGIVDEIVVVDTGSSDRTREIVREFGGQVIEMEWKDDFSIAKNRCLQETTGDYALCMDADEYIDPLHRFSLALLKKLLPQKKDIAFRTKVKLPQKEREVSVSCYLDRYKEYNITEYQVRLFPNIEGIGFQYNIFESIDESLAQFGIEVVDNDLLRITHSMDNREFREKRQISAALKLFDSVNEPEKVLEGGLLFLRLGDLDRAYPWFKKSENINPQLASKLALLYSNRGVNHKAKAIIEKALEHSPESLDLTLAMAEIYHKEGQYSEVVKLLAERIESVEEQLDQESVSSALFYYGVALLETGNMVTGIDQIAKAREKDPSNTNYKVGGIYAFSKFDQWEECVQIAGQIADEEGIDIGGEINDFVDIGKVFVEMNCYFTKAGKMKEANLCQKIVEEVIKTKLSGDEDIHRMSAIIERLG